MFHEHTHGSNASFYDSTHHGLALER